MMQDKDSFLPKQFCFASSVIRDNQGNQLRINLFGKDNEHLEKFLANFEIEFLFSELEGLTSVQDNNVRESSVTNNEMSHSSSLDLGNETTIGLDLDLLATKNLDTSKLIQFEFKAIVEGELPILLPALEEVEEVSVQPIKSPFERFIQDRTMFEIPVADGASLSKTIQSSGSLRCIIDNKGPGRATVEIRNGLTPGGGIPRGDVSSPGGLTLFSSRRQDSNRPYVVFIKAVGASASITGRCIIDSGEIPI